MQLSLSMGLVTKAIAKLSSYVLSGLVANWSSAISEDSKSLSDKSPEGNNASLLTGRYISTDGVDDKGINSDCSALGSGNYRLTGKVRAVGGNHIGLVTIDGVNGLSVYPQEGIWSDFSVDAASSTTASNVVVGWGGTSGGFNGSHDWSDVRLIDADTGETLAHWQLNDSSDSSLDGYEALDSSGNGIHGTHIGCSGHTSEGVDAALVKEGFTSNTDKTYFRADFTNFVKISPTPTITDGYIEMKIVANPKQVGSKFVLLRGTGNGNYLFAAQDGNSSAPTSGVGGVATVTVDGVEVTTRNELYDALTDGEIHTLRADGINLQYWASFIEINTYTDWKFNGSIYDLDINGQFFFSGENAVWTAVPALIGTSYANLVTVEDVSKTIPQSAAINWNKAPLPAPFSGDRLVPERDALDGIDALGNPIANPRPSSDTLNLFGDGEYADIVSSDSLNLGSGATWEIWGNLYGVRQEYYIVKHGQYAIGREPAGNYPQAADTIRVAFGGLAALNEFSGLPDSFGCLQIVLDEQMLYGYWNGQSLTKTYLAGQLPPTLAAFANTKDVNIGAFEGTTPVAFTNNQLAGAKIYSRALSAEEALENYNAQKSKYGIV